MEPIYKKYILVTSFIIAAVIFFSGFGLGWIVDHFREDRLLTAMQQNELDLESYIVEQQVIQTLGGDRCSLLSLRLENARGLLGDIGKDLSRWNPKKTGSLQKDEFDYMKRRYFILEIRFFSLLEELKQFCGTDYDVILFFYSVEHQDSQKQGYVLDELVGRSKNLVVLSIDRDYEAEPLVGLLAHKFDVDASPTIVVNGQKFEGFVSKAQVESLIGG